jgi:hypothetical protein
MRHKWITVTARRHAAFVVAGRLLPSSRAGPAKGRSGLRPDDQSDDQSCRTSDQAAASLIIPDHAHLYRGPVARRGRRVPWTEVTVARGLADLADQQMASPRRLILRLDRADHQTRARGVEVRPPARPPRLGASRFDGGSTGPTTAWLCLLPRGAAALCRSRSLQSTGPVHHPGTGMASSRSGACLMMRRRRMIRCWPMSGSAGCPAWRSVTAACPASGLTGPTCEYSVTCGRRPRTGWRISAVSVASRMPSTASTCTINCWHSGCTGMRSPVTAFRSRAPSAGCRANPRRGR